MHSGLWGNLMMETDAWCTCCNVYMQKHCPPKEATQLDEIATQELCALMVMHECLGVSSPNDRRKLSTKCYSKESLAANLFNSLNLRHWHVNNDFLLNNSWHWNHNFLNLELRHRHYFLDVLDLRYLNDLLDSLHLKCRKKLIYD